MNGPADPGQPGADLRGLGEQVRAGDRRQGRALQLGPVRPVDRDRDPQPPGPALGVGDDPPPQVRSRQVDGPHRGAPVQQARQRTHLGAGAEHGEVHAGEVQPLRVGHDRLEGVGEARLHDPVGDPHVELVAQVRPGQPAPVVGDHQVGDAATRAHDLGGGEPGLGVGREGLGEARGLPVPGERELPVEASPGRRGSWPPSRRRPAARRRPGRAPGPCTPCASSRCPRSAAASSASVARAASANTARPVPIDDCWPLVIGKSIPRWGSNSGMRSSGWVIRARRSPSGRRRR